MHVLSHLVLTKSLQDTYNYWVLFHRWGNWDLEKLNYLQKAIFDSQYSNLESPGPEPPSVATVPYWIPTVVSRTVLGTKKVEAGKHLKEAMTLWSKSVECA